MTKEFIPYEQALALKELGFDEPCLGYYVGKDREVYVPNEDVIAPFSPDLDSKVMFRAPLYQQSFSFFREKHKLIAYPQWRIDNTWDITIQQLDGYGLLSGQTTLSVIKKSTYEEAEQACLDKLIKIVKNGNK